MEPIIVMSAGVTSVWARLGWVMGVTMRYSCKQEGLGFVEVIDGPSCPLLG
jgi:hypothetical protein